MIIDSQNNCVIIPEDNFCIRGFIYPNGITISYETNIDKFKNNDKNYFEQKYKLEIILLKELLKYKQNKEREKENAAL